MAVWKNYLGTHNIGLDGVVKQQENYKKSNFKLAYTNVRYCFTGPIGNTDSEHIKPVASVSLPLLLKYDRQFFSFDRSHFISHWLYMSNANAVVYDDGVIKGYGVIRQCREGYKIGPLFADSADVTVIILQALCNSLPKAQLIYIDIPEPNIAAHTLVKKFRMKKNFLTARMYTQTIPDINLSSIFGNTTFEVG